MLMELLQVHSILRPDPSPERKAKAKI